MKVFFEEYGMVIIVTILAAGMITFAGGFKETLGDAIDASWNGMLDTANSSIS